LREIFSCIENDDIVLGDRYFPSFFLMADLQKLRIDKRSKSLIMAGNN